MVDTVHAKDLRLGDIVQLGEDAYMSATVRKIDKTSIWFFRPYTATADFSHTGGVICYTGVEEFSILLIDPRPFKLWRRGPELR